ncbi:hypothetical protein ACWEOE_10265 [Amycolatopsis sp. NPDC004368]
MANFPGVLNGVADVVDQASFTDRQRADFLAAWAAWASGTSARSSIPARRCSARNS